MLLDTNAVIGILAKNAELLAFLRQFDQLLVPSPALGELYFGAYKSQKQAFNLEAIHEFLSRGAIVLPITAETAQHYGAIRDELRRVGRPIPVNDLWIAAVARQQELPLASRDGHFDAVAGLTRRAW
ncbi:MAG: type II toxin-antitoxin system VapC family toxin [Hymenobacter sp.]|nr:MAG: type II toxin-antitoxin system VapC family toxin [Hymenobacter sp.]